MKHRMNLQLFEDGAGAGSNANGQGNNGNNAGNGNGSQNNAGGNNGYSFEQAEEIANARAQRATNSALKSYFQQQGMSEDEVSAALKDYKDKKASSQPNVSAIEQERDDALKKVTQMENTQLLSSKGVKADDLDYVMFKVEKLVDDKTDFKKAAEQYLKENPRFTGTGYRVSTGTQSGGGDSADGNDMINAAIRKAAGK